MGLLVCCFIAPQAPFEESATTEASRRCPLTGFLREFRDMFWGHVLEVFANGICVLAVQNTTPEMLRIGRILSDVCLFVVTLFFAATFSMIFMKNSFAFSRKITQKRGSRAAYDADRDSISDWPPCRGRCTLLKWRLRRHPLVGLFGGDVGDYHLRRHLPRGFHSSRGVIVALA